MIFISYQHDSKEFARMLRQRLHESDLVTFWDEDIRAGEEWKTVIDSAIKESVCVVVLVTVKALRSPYVTYEWSYALGHGKRVIPLILEMPDEKKPDHPRLHPKINDLQYRDFANADDLTWQRLLDELHEFVQQTQIPIEVTEAEASVRSSDPKTKRQGISTLERFEHPSAVESLAHFADSLDPETGILAAIALTNKTKGANDRAILGLVKSFERQYYLDDAMNCFRQIDSIEAVECLGRKLEDPQCSANLKSKILQTMSQMDNPTVVPYLARSLMTGSGNIFVVDALKKHKDALALPALQYHLELLWHQPANDAEHELRTIRAIAEMPDASVPDILYEVLQHHHSGGYSIDQLAFDTAMDRLIYIGTDKVLELFERGRKEMKQQDYTFSAATQRILTSRQSQ